MNKQEIDVVLKNCKDSYNGYPAAAGYEDLGKILLLEFNKNPQVSDKIIELGPAYTLLPGFLRKNILVKYIATDPFLYDRTVSAIKYNNSMYGSEYKNYSLFKKDAVSFFQKFPELKGIVVSADVLNTNVITIPEKDSEDYPIMNRYVSELAKSIYDTTPNNAFTVHINIDGFFTEKLIESGFRKETAALFLK